jgi:DNA-binding response OmpR family regulator/tetratricopeptide (TPR) repeat protein
VHLAATGDEALQLTSSTRFDAVLLDLRMPGMDGFTILETLRRFYSSLELPILMISASNDSADIAKALEQGANDYVEKPFDTRILRARVDTQLRLKIAMDRLKEKAPTRCDAVLQLLGLKGGPPSEEPAATVLIADDDASTRELVRRRLEPFRYTVVEASDGPGALELLANQTIDAVLLDVNMPGLSGYRTLARIRKRWNQFALPVILMTARDEPDDVLRGLEAGANDYVGKPLAFGVVAARLRTQVLVSRFFALLGYTSMQAKRVAQREGQPEASESPQPPRAVATPAPRPPPTPTALPRRLDSRQTAQIVERLDRELAILHASTPEVVLGIPSRANAELLKQAAQRMRRRYQAVLGEQGLPKEAHDLANQILALVEEAYLRLANTTKDPTSSFLTVVDHAIDARLQRARLLITQEEWNEAELLLSRALEIRADHPGILALLGWARLHKPTVSRLQRLTEARELLERAEQLNPMHPEGQLYYARLLVVDGKPREAQLRAQRAVRAAPTSREATNLLREIEQSLR